MSTKREVMNYCNDFNKSTRKLSVIAIKDLLQDGRTWEWILTALKIKEPYEWEQWGFGLMWNHSFAAQVEKIISRKEEAKEISFDDFWKEELADEEEEEPEEDIEPEEELPTIFSASAMSSVGYEEKEYDSETMQFPQSVLRKEVRNLNIPAIKYALQNETLDKQVIDIYNQFIQTGTVAQVLYEKFYNFQ